MMARKLRAWLAAYYLDLLMGVWSRRFLAFAAFFCLPVLIAPVFRYYMGRRGVDLGERALELFLNTFFFMLVVPLACLLHGSSVVREDVEQGTWAYHHLTPLAAWETLIAKLAAAITLVLTLALPSLLVTHLALFLGSDAGVTAYWEVTSRIAVAIAFGTIAYCSLFALFGVSLKRPLVIGVIYGLVCEYIFQLLPGETIVRHFTIIFHERSISLPERLRPGVGPESINIRAPWFFSLEAPVLAAWALLALAATYVVVASIVVSRRQFAAQKDIG